MQLYFIVLQLDFLVDMNFRVKNLRLTWCKNKKKRHARLEHVAITEVTR